jgi:hypothetical protein
LSSQCCARPLQHFMLRIWSLQHRASWLPITLFTVEYLRVILCNRHSNVCIISWLLLPLNSWLLPLNRTVHGAMERSWIDFLNVNHYCICSKIRVENADVIMNRLSVVIENCALHCNRDWVSLLCSYIASSHLQRKKCSMSYCDKTSLSFPELPVLFVSSVYNKGNL